MRMPALSLIALPGKLRAALELAKEAEKRGFAGIYSPSTTDSLTFCTMIALESTTIRFGNFVSPIYTRSALDYARTAASIHELASGRFLFGVGVSHDASLMRMGVSGSKQPLRAMRKFVAQYREAENTGEKPPIVIAGLRQRMVALACEIGDGLVFANAARSHLTSSLANLSLPEQSRNGFLIANMIPSCIDRDIARARKVCRKSLANYLLRPNYRNYWKEAGYEEEMNRVETCIADKRTDEVSNCISDRFLQETAVFGSVTKVRDELEAWFDCGVDTPILVPSAVDRGHYRAVEQHLDAFSR